MSKIIGWLTYPGETPVIFNVLYLYADTDQLRPGGLVEKVLSAYGYVVSSLHIHGACNRDLPVLRNITVVMEWFSFLMFSLKMSMGMSMPTFVIFIMISGVLL